ncbi:hypothetical protein B0T20DRAFT_397369 [Sordaria brevicollis]|uniref:Uncharacterized protein n=1 Tax=Sordaria brevicollis TaxID=83679 RepID=A0AAE0NWU1_SORBR|nr:hypothetical protein B0T20DRAFT_397369 [Sordaria brevicollis]
MPNREGTKSGLGRNDTGKRWRSNEAGFIHERQERCACSGNIRQNSPLNTECRARRNKVRQSEFRVPQMQPPVHQIRHDRPSGTDHSRETPGMESKSTSGKVYLHDRPVSSSPRSGPVEQHKHLHRKSIVSSRPAHELNSGLKYHHWLPLHSLSGQSFSTTSGIHVLPLIPTVPLLATFAPSQCSQPKLCHNVVFASCLIICLIQVH